MMTSETTWFTRHDEDRVMPEDPLLPDDDTDDEPPLLDNDPVPTVSAADLRGLVPGMTDGVPAEEYVRAVRDA